MESDAITKMKLERLSIGNIVVEEKRLIHFCTEKKVDCLEVNWLKGRLFLRFSGGYPYNDGYRIFIPVNHCPYCGYEAKNKNEKYNKFS